MVDTESKCETEEYKSCIVCDNLGHKKLYITTPDVIYKDVGFVREGNTRNPLIKLIDPDGNYYACKVRRITNDENENNLILNEFLIPKKLQSDNVPNVRHYFKQEKRVFIIYDYIEGIDLLDYLQDRYLDEFQLKKIIRKMAECIKVCHDKNIIHMDIKCENFILTNENPLTLKLIDFEFAMKEGTKLTNLKGTEYYIAPEIFSFNKCPSKKADIWSLGAVAYCLFTDDYETKFLRKGFVNYHSLILSRGKKCSLKFAMFLQKALCIPERYRPDIDQILNDPWLNTK